MDRAARAPAAELDPEISAAVLAMTWQRLQDDHWASHGGVTGQVVGADGAHARRFVTPGAFQRLHEAIEDLCRERGACDGARDYFTTHWLQRFAPRLA